VVLGRTVGDNQWAVAVFDTKSGTQSSRHPVPLATAAGCPFCMAAVNKFRWSPDGARILLSWGNTIIIDVEASRANVVSDTWSSAEWGDGGNVVYLLEVGRQPGVMQLKGFYAIDPASGKRELLLAADSLTDSEITHSAFVHVPLLNSTYDGKQLVINSDVEGDGTMLRFYDLSKQDPPDLRKPDKTTKVAETMPQVVWSPSGRSLAAIAASDWKIFKLMKFDLTKNEWSVIAKLALGDDTHPEVFALKVLSWAQ
jgi:WD40 repeat protein